MRQLSRHSFAFIALAAAVSLLPAASAGAQRRISQFRALAGGLTPGDTPGFPVTISRPGSYLLAGNLVLPAAPGTVGIDVTAEGVSLDLNGFAVIGPRVCPNEDATTACAPGIEDAAFIAVRAGRNFTIHDGTVRGSGGEGIVAGPDARIENVEVLWNSIFGILAGKGSQLRNNLVAQNGQGALVGDECSLVGNRVRANTFFGVQIGPNCGYAQNVFVCSSGTCVSGGAPLGPNLCNGVACP